MNFVKLIIGLIHKWNQNTYWFSLFFSFFFSLFYKNNRKIRKWKFEEKGEDRILKARLFIKINIIKL